MGTLARTEFGALTLKERLAAKKQNAALILDISGSMNEDVEPGRTKLAAARDIVDGLTGVSDVYVFNNTAQCIKKSDIPTCGSQSTHMAQAINACKLNGIRSAIMITDGDASDKPEALEAVKGFHLQIMYVGAGAKPAFLDELAKAGDGYCTKDDIKLTKELTTKIQALLGPGTDAVASGRGDIQL